jgi:hypothetical protein
MKKNLYLLILLLFSSEIIAQVGINATGAAPASSAMLDVSSTSKGMLIPRMTTAQRTIIASPAQGLLVFDATTNSFWFYNGLAWGELINNGTSYWTPTAGNTNLFSSYNFFTLSGGTNIGALISGVGNDGTLRIFSPLSVNNPSYLNLDATNIQARRQNIFTGVKTEVDLKLNPFGGNVSIGLASNLATAKFHLSGNMRVDGTTYSSIFNNSSTEDTYIRGGKFGSYLVLNDIPNGNILMGATNTKVGLNTIPAVGLDINGAVAYRSTAVTLTSGVSYESYSTTNTSHLIINVPQYTTGINLQDGNVIGQLMIVQVKVSFVPFLIPPLNLPDNAALTNINLNGGFGMYNNSVLSLIWDGTDWQEISRSINN